MIKPAFTNTKVSVDRTMSEIEGLLSKRGVLDARYTHSRPRGEQGPEGIGTITYEFVWPGKSEIERRGVRLVVAYRPVVWKGVRKVRGVTGQMAARALFWLLKAKFDSIDFGVEEFEVAFMPHLVTELGFTFAEQPNMIAEAMAQPDRLTDMRALAPGTALALPSGERDG